jgi:hypothetical protein
MGLWDVTTRGLIPAEPGKDDGGRARAACPLHGTPGGVQEDSHRR